jgi:hypothetical protein
MSQMPDVFPGFPRGRFVMDPPTSTTADFLHFRLQPENPSAPSDEMREIPLVCPKISKRQFMKDFPTDLYLESVPFSLSTRIPPQEQAAQPLALGVPQNSGAPAASFLRTVQRTEEIFGRTVEIADHDLATPDAQPSRFVSPTLSQILRVVRAREPEEVAYTDLAAPNAQRRRFVSPGLPQTPSVARDRGSEEVPDTDLAAPDAQRRRFS